MALQLCSLDDVRQRTTSTIEDGPLADLIEAVSDQIEAYVGAWLAPRPDPPATEMTLLFDVERDGGALRLAVNDRAVGIRTVSAVGIATTGQAETGGTYTTVPLTGVLLRPRPTADGPAYRLYLPSGTFSRGFNTVTVTGAFGPAAIAPRVREIAIKMVASALKASPGLTAQQTGTWSETYVVGTDWQADLQPLMLGPGFAV